MRIFKDCEFEKECPICKKTTKGDAVLIGVNGTQSGGNIQAELFHIDCIELVYFQRDGEHLIAQRWE